MTEQEIQRMLGAEAERASSLPQGFEDEITTRVTRARRARNVRTASAAVASVLAAGLLTASLRDSAPTGGSDAVAGTPVTSHSGAPASLPGPGEGQEPGFFTCNRPVPFATVTEADGFSLTLTSHRKDTDAAPWIGFDINQPHVQGLSPTEIPPTVVLLRNGVVVGGPVPVGGLIRVKQPAGTVWLPESSGRIQVEVKAQSWLCGKTTWQQVWTHPDEYTLAVVMTTPTVGPEPEFTGFGTITRPVLVAEAPLATLAG